MGSDYYVGGLLPFDHLTVGTKDICFTGGDFNSILLEKMEKSGLETIWKTKLVSQDVQYLHHCRYECAKNVVFFSLASQSMYITLHMNMNFNY